MLKNLQGAYNSGNIKEFNSGKLSEFKTFWGNF